MRKFLIYVLFLLLMLSQTAIAAGPYYVDFDAGDDTAAGTSEETAWKYLPWMDGATGNSDAKALTDSELVYVKWGTECTDVGCRMNEHDNGTSDYITIMGKSDWGSGSSPLICPLRSWTANWVAVSGLSNVYYHTAMADFAWIFWGAGATSPGTMKEHVLDLDTDGQFSFPAIGTINYDNLSGGPFTIGETITGGTNGYTAKVLADTGSTLTVEQYSHPTIPYDDDEGLTGATSGATCDVNGASQPARAYIVCVYSDTDLTSSPGTVYYSGGDGYGPFESDEVSGGFKYHKWVNLRIWGGGRGGLFYVQEDNVATASGYLHISGCGFKYNGTGSTFAGADSFDTASVVIGDQNNAGTIGNLYVANNTMTDIARRGIMIGRLDNGTNYVGYNVISDIWGEHPFYFDRPVGIYSSTTEGLTIEHNDVEYRTGEVSSNEFSVGIWNMESVILGGGNQIQYNHVKGFGYGLFSECGESDDVFRENHVIDCLAGLVATGETGGAGIKSVKWYNNTVDASVYGIWHKGYQTASTEMEYKNNALVNMNPTYFAYIENDNQNGTITFDYNGYEVDPSTAGKFFWQSDGAISFETWDNSRDTHGQCAADLDVDSDGIPQAGSELINNGTVPTGEASNFLIEPSTATIDPWSVAVATDDCDSREIGAFQYWTDGCLQETIDGVIPRIATFISGHSGYARVFDGTEGLWTPDGGSTDVSGNTSLTFGIRAYPTNLSTGENQFLAGKWRAASGERQYGLWYYDSGNRFECAISPDGETYTQAYTAFTPQEDTPVDVVCVYNHTAGTLSIYIDGGLDPYTEGETQYNPRSYSGGIFNGSAPFTIGVDGSLAAKYFVGQLDEPIVYPGALTAQQVADMHTNGIDGTKGGSD